MKKAIIFFSIMSVFASCKKDNTTVNNNTEPATYNTDSAYTLYNLSYGSDAQQNINLFLPANRDSASTKVFVLIHGGAWSAGDKSDFNDLFNTLKTYYTHHAIININYRLGSSSNPGYPKQMEDIQAALTKIQQPKYNLSKQYMLIGNSAGGHLSMLYAYAFDNNHYVKGIINTVGPADLTDTAYLNYTSYLGIFSAFIGNAAYNYFTNRALFEEVSPAKRVTPNSPPTLSFYGDQDPLIPSTQIGLLRSALEANGVYHFDTLYAGGGHGVWATNEQNTDYRNKIAGFIDLFFI